MKIQRELPIISCHLLHKLLPAEEKYFSFLGVIIQLLMAAVYETITYVMSLAEGHLAALRYIQNYNGLLTVNIGTGQAISVMHMVEAFERVSGRKDLL